MQEPVVVPELMPLPDVVNELRDAHKAAIFVDDAGELFAGVAQFVHD